MDGLLGGLLTGVGLVVVVVVVSAIAQRLGALAPILLVATGVGLSYLPGMPSIQLDHELVLFGVLPPLLYVAAIETSVPAFRSLLRPILLLAVGLVLFTAACVGLVLHAVVPGLPLAVCFALGAVVAPPDAVAATAIARRLGLPRRLVTILEGESLVNDATALVTLRVAVAAAVGQAINAGDIAVTALVAAGGGLVVGGVGAWLLAWIHRKVTDPLFDNALSLLTPFLVFFLAEVVHASGVVAVVVCGLYLGHRWPLLMSAASRLQMDAFWRMVRFLLEGGVFLLVGLQMRNILADIAALPTGTVEIATAAVVAVVLVTRFVWVYGAASLAWLVPPVTGVLSPREPAVVSWAGMRGVVTLAAALSVPSTLADGSPFPGRALLVWLAFAVIVVTLVVQGATLPFVVRLLRIPGDDPAADALAEAAVQHEASRAARDVLDQADDDAPPEVVGQLRALTEKRSNRAWERLGDQQRETPSAAYRRLRRAMLEAEREVFLRARDDGRIDDEVLRRVQRDMDLEESQLAREY